MPGVCRLGDIAQCPSDSHSCKSCPHSVQGPAVQGSSDVIINGQPALRVGDTGVHAACCGPNTWVAAGGSVNVFFNGKPAVRIGDPTTHCGGAGTMAVGSSNVIVGGGQEGAKAYLQNTYSPLWDARKVIEKSPTLKKDLEQLVKDGWDIKYGEAGKGSYANKETLEIVIDESEKGSTERIAQTISHEKGHALYRADPYVSPVGLSKEEYVNRNVKRLLKDEGEATLINLEIREGILSNGGPDTGVAGTKGDQYEKIYEEYKKSGNREIAREKIGDIFADGERPSNEKTMTYREYYGRVYKEYYDGISKSKKP